MKMQELKNKDAKDLEKMSLDFKKELFNLRFQRVSGKLTKPHRIRYIRRSVAKIKTLLNENVAKIASKSTGIARADVAKKAVDKKSKSTKNARKVKDA